MICASGSVVEHHLAKVGAAGSNPVSRSFIFLLKSRASGFSGSSFCLHNQKLLKFFAKALQFLFDSLK